MLRLHEVVYISSFTPGHPCELLSKFYPQFFIITLFNLLAGDYKLEVTDAAGCIENIIFNIMEPITAMITLSDACVGYFFWLWAGKPWDVDSFKMYFFERRVG